MIRKILVMLLLVTSVVCNAQIQNPVKWSFASRSTGVGEAELVLTATIENGWHLYSQFIAEGGPVPTSFKFEKSADYELVGKVKETSTVIKAFEKAFNMDIAYFANKAVFVQKIKLKKSQVAVKGSVEFMVCNDEQCLPPDEHPFTISLKDDKVAAATTENATTSPVATAAKADSAATASAALDSVSPDTAKASVADTTKVASTTSQKSQGDKMSLWAIFLAGLGGGFAAFFMPCIFPMVPFTVSFFTKKSSNRSQGIIKALIYAFSIIVIYVGLGLLITILFGSDALNALSTNGIFNFAFFLLLVVFAASFLGAFEITLPSKWVNKADQNSEKGGLLGIFFMAATLALVSFSCTGPIIGTLLFQAAALGQYTGPAIGMLGFAIALALPFTLFAMFPSWLKSMPKSGGWLNSIKVVLGFLELALALKFLSNVDLAYHWNWFDREIFLVLWIVIFGMLGFYLLGKLRFPHDSEVKTISVFRLFLAIITLSFTMYMIPGLWGAPLRSIAAFLPPPQTQDFDLYTSTLGAGSGGAHKARKYSDKFHAPLNLDAYFDYDEGMAYAKEVGKPVMIDFTGHACVNCRKMENDVWPNKKVLDIIDKDYVLIQLFVDDKTDLDKSEQYVSKFSGKNIHTIGNKWSDFQASKYSANSQPYYVLLDNSGNVLVKPQGANYNVDEFAAYLKSGADAYKKGKMQ
ncbi:MAG: Protein-disulfide reductase [Bacteroidetes bacterium]|nr:Protein-disulfide reductase [Bacteroidota bacterium]